jgi:hypothetical protein
VVNENTNTVPSVRHFATEIFDIGIDLGSIVAPLYYNNAPFAFERPIEEVENVLNFRINLGASK